jgi:hypothetical protein
LNGRADFVAAREPAECDRRALFSESGIVDAEALVKTLLRLGGAARSSSCPMKLLGATTSNGGVELRTERETIKAAQVVMPPVYQTNVANGRRRNLHDHPCREYASSFRPSARS